MRTLGVDIGATTIKLAVVSDAGATEVESAFQTPQSSAREVACALVAHVHDILSAYPEIRRIGVGVPGAMNRDRSLVRYPPNLIGWKEEPLQAYLQELLPTFDLVEVDNDAKVAALAESRFGAGIGVSHFLLVTLGTGVGGCVWSTEGRWTGIYRGASGGAGEFGHMSIDLNGPPCNCGSRGCIEAYVGLNYLSERTKRKLESNPAMSSKLSAQDELTPKIIADAMNNGDAFARSVFEEAGSLIGRALANVANLLDMHVFILGGGVAEAGPVLFDAALASLRANVLTNLRPVVEVRKAALGNRAGVIGAALLVNGE
ncbi:MAG: ROK family protein [Bacteroidota bacterium]|nr:ROK family protein [Bacteroidota bacterium]MDP4242574.1 ROK family protein [Bacteroidota bacterium]MDP4288088.1 ROK family protein [Bacteroidota bacterium]